MLTNESAKEILKQLGVPVSDPAKDIPFGPLHSKMTEDQKKILLSAFEPRK